jgi:hypothetical protein
VPGLFIIIPVRIPTLRRVGFPGRRHALLNPKHQQDVLDHVDGEGGLVEGGEMGADGDPEKGDAGEKRGETCGRDQIVGRASEENPAAEIEESRDDQGDVDQDRWRPVVEEGLGEGRHSN